MYSLKFSISVINNFTKAQKIAPSLISISIFKISNSSQNFIQIIMTQILLGGDSWACGEWARPEGAPGHVPVEIVHRGIEQYFIDDGFGVVNTAEGGSSNKSAVERLAAVVDDHLIM